MQTSISVTKRENVFNDTYVIQRCWPMQLGEWPLYTNEIEELDVIYGTAAPIRVDNKLEELRQHHSKHKCKGATVRVERE
ncbi:hypothetical protein KIN20_014173 [Parelaphostrongylus tenuis]|uniref:Uncharacterized protein n=1 Tax=Parelaphostrongylus tenuis TaxID=148309 RepID=A0AAD5MZ48_PARTN|nr:hypothetical protein KIN20_014173 [Parelaphostrongylus tenuis]